MHFRINQLLLWAFILLYYFLGGPDKRDGFAWRFSTRLRWPNEGRALPLDGYIRGSVNSLAGTLPRSFPAILPPVHPASPSWHTLFRSELLALCLELVLYGMSSLPPYACYPSRFLGVYFVLFVGCIRVSDMTYVLFYKEQRPGFIAKATTCVRVSPLPSLPSQSPPPLAPPLLLPTIFISPGLTPPA